MINALNSLDKRELEVFWRFYLPRLATSIKVNTTAETPCKFSKAPGFGAPLGSTSWAGRASNWYGSRDVIAYHIKSCTFVDNPGSYDSKSLLPIFPNYVIQALKGMKRELKQGNPCMEIPRPEQSPNTFKQESNTMKDTMNKMLEKNKDAVAMAAQLSAGKTANSFFLNKLLGKFPWYAKLFSRKNDVANNPVAKIVAAQTALTLVTHFAADNQKLNYIAEGMVQEALVDITLNSQMLESLIGELEGLVTIPNFKD